MATEHARAANGRARLVILGVGSLVLGAAAVALAGQTAPPGKAFAAEQLACAATAVRAAPTPVATIEASTLPERRTFGPGDTLVIDAGANKAIAVGQEFFVRRVLLPMDRSGAKEPWFYVRTAGWIRVTEVHASNALAQVVFACDAFEKGDLLEPFALPAVPAPIDPPGAPDYTSTGQILLGQDRRITTGTNFFVAVDLGSDHGIKPGQRLTVYRRLSGAEGPVNVIAQATAWLVLPESAVLRVDNALQAIFVGDLVAPHR
jgi:hypothetical protein